MNYMTTDDQIKEIRERWFDEHVGTYYKITLPDGQLMERMLWAKPEAWDYRIIYTRVAGTLYIDGDVGQAIYRWSGEAWLSNIAGYGLSYCVGKCDASEHGRGYEEWDADLALQDVDRIVPEMIENGYLDNGNETDSLDEDGNCIYCMKRACGGSNKCDERKEEEVPSSESDATKFKREFDDSGVRDSLSSEMEFSTWGNTRAQEVFDQFGMCWYEHFGNIGKRPAMRAVSHFIGIRMASEQGVFGATDKKAPE